MRWHTAGRPKLVANEPAMPDFKTDYQSRPVCPHCGHVHQDAWEWDFGGAEGDRDCFCGRCEKPFRCSRTIVVEYSTKPVAETPDFEPGPVL
jgi:hypothetical protein